MDFCAVIIFLLDWVVGVVIFNGMEKTKRNKIFWGFVILLFILMIAELGMRYYDTWHSQKRVEELAAELERLEQEDYAKKAADTIGSATPRETLDMFIDAVEAGDYELASKYFVLEKQEEELNELIELNDNNNVVWLLKVLKRAQVDSEISEGRFRMKSSTELGPNYFVRFILYPSGNWKIEEI